VLGTEIAGMQEAEVDAGRGLTHGAVLTTRFSREVRSAGERMMDETDDVSPDHGTSSYFLGSRDEWWQSEIKRKVGLVDSVFLSSDSSLLYT
jgi:hypothetical protein